jgi:DNA-binding beta-propeller fold protein YncE
VYRTDVHPFAFLPHSVNWQILSILLAGAGAVVAALGDHEWAATLLLGTGLVGIAATLQKNVAYSLRSEVTSLPGRRLWYRAVVAYLHFLQPFARVSGLIRGVLAPPEVTLPAAEPQTSRGPRPSLREAWRALLLGAGSVAEDRFWSESWTSADRVLSELTDWLRRSRAVRRIEIDEGWSLDRDVSILVGRWAWLDLRALVEDHGGGRSLIRISTYLRPTSVGVLSSMFLAAALVASTVAGVALRYPLAGATAAVVAVALLAFAAYRIAQATAILHRAVRAITVGRGMSTLKSGPARLPLLSPSLLRVYGLRTAAVFVIALLAVASGTFMLREAATAQIIGARKGYAGDNGPAIEAWLDTPGGVAVSPSGELFIADSNNHVIRKVDAQNRYITTVVGNNSLGAGFSGDYGPATAAQLNTPDGVAIAPDGDLIVADSHNHRVRRVDRETGEIITIAGSGRDGYSGDDGPGTEAELNTPSAVAAARNGDIYIADTLNYRVRMIDHATGFIHTVAGLGTPGDGEPVGDGGPATSAYLNMPSDVAIGPGGDVYIADMHHQRVRLVDAKTRIISTVAGTGRWGYTGDGGPATQASLAGPAGIAVVPESNGRVTIFIADYYNGHVRAVGPDGIIREISDGGRDAFGAPSRVAYSPQHGWLYVADSSRDRLVVLNMQQIAPTLVPLPAPPEPARAASRRRVAG